MQPQDSNTSATPAESIDVSLPPAESASHLKFYSSEKCAEARQALEKIMQDPACQTDSAYFEASSMDFIERHLYHLYTHPNTNVAGYLSNLRLMTSSRIRNN